MPKPPPPRSRDISGRLVFLGTGTSVGVPVIGCGCAVCRSSDPRNQRTRCGLAIGLPAGNLLIDTPPDLRMQLLREAIGVVHAVVYTHEHADHVFGLDDLRLMQFYIDGPLPLYCNAKTADRIRRSFDYAFQSVEGLHAGAIPLVEVQSIGEGPFNVLGASIVPIPLEHGPHFDVLGFRLGDVAYCTDVKGIPPQSKQLLQGLDTLILGCLRHKPHATHFSLDEALAAIEELRPQRTLLTHCSHDFDYEQTTAQLPPGVHLAYDGLEIPLTTGGRTI